MRRLPQVWALTRLVRITSIDTRVGHMRFPVWMLAAMLSLTGAGTGHAKVRIANDRGGIIERYIDRYKQLRASRQSVIIDGLCASACTIVLSEIPHDRICVTSKARLGFHAAWDFGLRGRAVTNRGATRWLYSMYPLPVRHWIAGRGGLTPRTIFLQGRQLEEMYRPCDLNALASLGTRR